MSKPSRWSTPSAACRIEIRPSRACALGLALLGLLGAGSWGLSDAPALLAWSGAVLWLVAGCWLAARELRRPGARLMLGAEGRGELDGRAVDDLRVEWRGPFYVIAWREGGRRACWFAFPDALDARHRRELRLWAPPARERGATAAVAP